MSALIPPSPCPNCGKVLDAATGVDKRRRPNDRMVPRPGNVSVCISCGHICVFDKKLRLRNPTEAEMVQIAGDPRVIQIMKARAKVFP